MNSQEQKNLQAQYSQTEIENLRSQLYEVQSQLRQSQALIQAMESSKFWKIRTQWFKFKATLGLGETTKVCETKLPDLGEKSKDIYLLGMTSPLEQAYVQHYAENCYSGRGEIVELGCFLGSFSIKLASGLKNNSKVINKQKRIHTYDIFVCDDYVVNHFLVGTQLDRKYQIGDSFVDEYVRRISEYQEQIKVNSSDLNTTKWSGGEIEFLLIDSMKSWSLANSITQNFFPYLIPDKSLIMHQDFSHFYTYWIHLLMYRFRDYFEPMYHLPSSSVVFKYKKKIPQNLLMDIYSLSSFSPDEVSKAFEYSLTILPKEMQANVIAAKIVAYCCLGNINEAKLEMEMSKINGIYSEQSELPFAEKYIFQPHTNSI